MNFKKLFQFSPEFNSQIPQMSIIIGKDSFNLYKKFLGKSKASKILHLIQIFEFLMSIMLKLCHKIPHNLNFNL